MARGLQSVEVNRGGNRHPYLLGQITQIPTNQVVIGVRELARDLRFAKRAVDLFPLRPPTRMLQRLSPGIRALNRRTLT
jgi:hypothetical protein